MAGASAAANGGAVTAGGSSSSADLMQGQSSANKRQRHAGDSAVVGVSATTEHRSTHGDVTQNQRLTHKGHMALSVTIDDSVGREHRRSIDLGADHTVVAVADEAARLRQSNSTKSSEFVAEDIGAWLKNLDGGSLVQYETMLLSLFDNVSQISTLYADRLQDFFEDVRVEDPNHRLAFASALRALGKRQRSR